MPIVEAVGTAATSKTRKSLAKAMEQTMAVEIGRLIESGVSPTNVEKISELRKRVREHFFPTQPEGE